MQRPMVSMGKSGDMAAWLQYDAFSPKLDFFNFGSKTGTTSTIDSQNTLNAGVAWAVTDKVRISYGYSRSKILASRQQEPRHLNTRFTGHELRAQFTAYDSYPLMITLGAGYRGHKSDRENFTQYYIGTSNTTATFLSNSGLGLSYNGTTGNIQTSNGSPLAIFETNDKALLTNMRLLYEPTDSFNISIGGELRLVTVEARFTIPALNDPAVKSAAQGISQFTKFLADVPQATPWKETHLLLQASFNWQPFGENITIGTDITHYQIKRRGYIPNANRPINYTSSEQLDAYVFWQVFKKVTLYGHGRASTRYVLGDLPLTYNSRSNHRFGNPFGFLSFGGVLTF